MDTPARGKTLRDYSPTLPAPPQFSLPREPGSSDRFSSRQKTPGVGEVRGTSSSMGPKSIVSGGTVSPGAFYAMRTVVSEDATNGDIYLQGGQVSGWGTPIDEILIYDASATAWQGTVGQVLKMTVTGSGSKTSGILDPSFTPSGVSTPVAASSLGSNTFPSSGSLSGKVCQISLGTFFGTGATVEGFQPAGSGNLQVAFCWSGYTISRF